jgi:hypothetical protein
MKRIDELSKKVERISTKRGPLRNLMTTATEGVCWVKQKK